ncbi:class I SAM-dependent DNA methyltransferase [Streptomyces sp. NPDC088116]|uniref:class I SAM-dependent DNA methyltransferase n=1 Tax=Streptomyces sp. NPDC088116 TaxID=3365825 RepID=UPI0037FCC54E
MSATSLPHSERARQSYDHLADRYDNITDGEDYDIRCSLYLELIRKHGAPGDRLLDLACGTGKGALRFAKAGFSVTGVDYSEGMLKAAAAKPGASEVHFAPGDLRRLPPLHPFDVAVTLGSPLNYMHDESELRAALDGVSRLLRPGGLFVFDLGTLGLRESLLSGPRVFDNPNSMVVMRGYPAPLDHLLDFRMDCFSSADGRTWNLTTLQHHLFHFSADTAERLLEEAGMTALGRYGLSPDQSELVPGTVDRDHWLMLIAARKNSREPHSEPFPTSR